MADAGSSLEVEEVELETIEQPPSHQSVIMLQLSPALHWKQKKRIVRLNVACSYEPHISLISLSATSIGEF